MGIKVTSPKAELTVLRGLFHRDKRIAGTLLGNVDESYFDNFESVEIFKALRKHMATTGEIPAYKIMLEDTTISQEARTFLRDSEPTIQTIEDASKSAKILNKYRQLRAMYNIALDINRAMTSGRFEHEALMEDLSNKVSQLRSSRNTKNAFLHFGKNNNSYELVKDLIYNKDNDDVIPTGIAPFDNESGGLLRGSLFSLGGSSGGGKSLLAAQLAYNMTKLGFKVVMVPLEMSKPEMTARFLSNISGLDVTRILQRRLASGEQALLEKRYKIWVRKMNAVGGRLSVFKPEEDMSIEEVFAAVNSYNCDVVIIDYISLLKGADSDDAWQKLGAMARVAKINAGATNRVNILLCQVNEDGKIRYSRAISEHSVNSWIWVTPKAEREKEVGHIRVEQPKARNSRSFSFELGFKWANMKVVAVEPLSDIGSPPSLPNRADV